MSILDEVVIDTVLKSARVRDAIEGMIQDVDPLYGLKDKVDDHASHLRDLDDEAEDLRTRVDDLVEQVSHIVEGLQNLVSNL